MEEDKKPNQLDNDFDNYPWIVKQEFKYEIDDVLDWSESISDESSENFIFGANELYEFNNLVKRDRESFFNTQSNVNDNIDLSMINDLL